MKNWTKTSVELSWQEDRWNNGGSDSNPVISTPSHTHIYEGLSVYNDHVGVSNAPVVNPHSYLRFREFRPRGFEIHRSTSDSRIFYQKRGVGVVGQIPNRSSYELTRSTDAYRRALRKLYDDIRQSDLNLSTDLAESGQAYRMVKGATREVVNIVRTLPRGKGLANAWLALQYGWKPLLSSIHGVATFTSTNLLQREVRGRGTSRFIPESTVPGFPALTRTGLVEQTCILGGRIRVTNPPLYDLTRLASLNPVGIAWELLPLSFVADWFIDIGGYMADAETSLGIGYDFLYGYQTWITRSTELFGGTLNGIRTYGSNIASTSSSFMSAQRFVHKDRSTLASVPFPPRPQFKPNLGSSQLLSAAALIRQRFA